MSTTTTHTLLRVLREIALTVGAIAGVLCLLSTAAALALDVKPVIFRSGSMAPAIDTGALAFSRTVPAADLRVGDVVTVPSGSGDLVTHRIQDISMSDDEANLVLRGDANAIADDRVYVVESAPRVLFDVPQAGRVVAFATGPIGVFASGVLVALVLVLITRSWGSTARSPSDVDRADSGGAGSPGSPVTIGATVLVGLVIAAGATTSTKTLAYYQDSAAATSGTLAAEPPPPAGCEDAASGVLACPDDTPPQDADRGLDLTPSSDVPTQPAPTLAEPTVPEPPSEGPADTTPTDDDGADISAP